MELENALYAGVQVVHNFGAVAIAGVPIAALYFDQTRASALRGMAGLVLAAWLLQAASGAGFGVVSYFMEGELPEIHHVARAALIVKVICAASAITILAVFFAKGAARSPSLAAWRVLGALGLTALTAAALLRWFS
jgi:hypothetical protein